MENAEFLKRFLRLINRKLTNEPDTTHHFFHAKFQQGFGFLRNPFILIAPITVIDRSQKTFWEQAMKNSPPAEGVEITQLLKRHKNGDAEALEQLMPHIYHELRRIAQFHLRSNGTGSTLQPTALVNEAYLQLFDGHSIDWQNRAHFFNVIGRQMRWLVVDHARRTHAKKRGGMTTKISIEDVTIANSQSRQNIDFLALDQALNRLETMYPRVGKVVELRYFVGLNELQTAEILEISDRQVRRDWAFAKGWLLDQLQSINRNDER